MCERPGGRVCVRERDRDRDRDRDSTKGFGDVDFVGGSGSGVKCRAHTWCKRESSGTEAREA